MASTLPGAVANEIQSRIDTLSSTITDESTLVPLEQELFFLRSIYPGSTTQSPRSTTGSIETTAGNTTNGAITIYFYVRSGSVTIGGMAFSQGQYLNLEYCGEMGRASIAYDATGGQLEIWETV